MDFLAYSAPAKIFFGAFISYMYNISNPNTFTFTLGCLFVLFQFVSSYFAKFQITFGFSTNFEDFIYVTLAFYDGVMEEQISNKVSSILKF